MKCHEDRSQDTTSTIRSEQINIPAIFSCLVSYPNLLSPTKQIFPKEVTV